jgi:hypothetical protein
MERTQIFDLMGELKLFGMRSAYDEVMSTGIKRQHEPPRIVGDLLQAEIAETFRAFSSRAGWPRKR